MVQEGLRATFIKDDGTAEKRVDGVALSYLDDAETLPKVVVSSDDVPAWAGNGTDVVVAPGDGSVECAFTTGFIGVVMLDSVGDACWPDWDGEVRTFSPAG